jgi:gas vesicle protein
MLSVKNVIKAINKEKIKAINKEKRNERAKSLTLAVALGAATGAVSAMLIAPNSESISKSLNKVKDKVSETMQKGKGKVEELIKERKDKIDNV